MISIPINKESLSIFGAIFLAISAFVAWLVSQWRQEEKSKKAEEKLKIEAQKAQLAAENAALDLKNQMPEIVLSHFSKVEEFLDENVQRFKLRLKQAEEKIRELSSELERMRADSAVNTDDYNRVSDDVTNLEEEMTELDHLLQLTENKRELANEVISVLASKELDIDLINAAEENMDAKLRLSGAGRTTKRVLARHNREMATKNASTIAKFKAMEQRLEALEMKAKSAKQMKMDLD